MGAIYTLTCDPNSEPRREPTQHLAGQGIRPTYTQVLYSSKYHGPNEQRGILGERALFPRLSEVRGHIRRVI